MALHRNLIANYLGQAWVALMGFAFIPLYVRYLGIEAYGLVGLFATLQVWLALLDMGLTPAMSREMARFGGGGQTPQGIRDLMRSVETVLAGLMVPIIAATVLLAPWIAGHWLQVQAMPLTVVAQAIVIMVAVIALRMLEGIYRSCLIGLQQQVRLNVASAFLATLRWFGAVGVVAWVSPSVEAFFIWQGVSSVVSILLLASMTYRRIPVGTRRARASLQALREVGGFAGGMVGISITTLLLTQVDKVLLSRLLPLSDFAYYTLASTVAGGLYTLISPVSQAYYPRLCELHARQDSAALQDAYHTSAQLISVIAGSAALVILVFATDLLQLWTQDTHLTRSVGPLLSILIFGNLLNSLMWMPYQAQLAHGWTRLTLHTNIVAVLFAVPVIFVVTPIYGAVGAAWVWVALNAGYLCISVQFMYRRILSREKWRWYIQDVLAPLLPAGLLVYALGLFLPAPASPGGHFGRLAVAACLALSLASVMADRVRARILRTLFRQ